MPDGSRPRPIPMAVPPGKRMRQARMTFSGMSSTRSGGAGDSETRARPNEKQIYTEELWNDSTATVLHFESDGWYTDISARLKDEQIPVAAFDLDGTLIRNQSGAKFPTALDDYAPWSSSVIPKLKELHEKGFAIVIFSNQGGVNPKRLKGVPGMKHRVEGIAEMLGVPLIAYLAMGRNRFRKPCIGMWELLATRLGGVENIDLSKSFYVGDAAGRPEKKALKRKADFSDSDLKFALNLPIEFYTPDAYFEGKPMEQGSIDFVPRKFLTLDAYNVGEPSNAEEAVKYLKELLKEDDVVSMIEKGFSVGDAKPDTQTFVMISGAPATGKTTFAKRFLASYGYKWINMDSMGTLSKCVKAARAALEEGKSVVVDNTNGIAKTRTRYLDLARERDEKVSKKMPKICLCMDTPRDLSNHLNVVREITTSGVISRIPHVAVNGYYKRLVEPNPDEGFDAVLKVGFKAHFASEHDKNIFARYT